MSLQDFTHPPKPVVQREGLKANAAIKDLKKHHELSFSGITF